MSLSDQQLRQELVNYGETVPPITQRNREQLRARLDILRSRPRSPVESPPSRIRSTASPSRLVRGLIELSDSETDTSSPSYSRGRETKIPTRSIAGGRDSSSIQTPNKAADVEQSIARHRREIQQLIDSARERNRTANSSISSEQNEPPRTTPLRPNSASSRSRQPYKPDFGKPKQPSSFNRFEETIRSFWKNYHDSILSLLKALIVGLPLAVGLIFLAMKGKDFITHRKGEADCGFRLKSDFRATKPEINRYLDDKGFKFEMGPQERWKALVAYITEKPVDEISVWDNQNKPTDDIDHAFKLSSAEGIHSLACRARKGVQSIMHYLAWLLLGTTGFLSICWFLKRRLNSELQRSLKPDSDSDPIVVGPGVRVAKTIFGFEVGFNIRAI